MSGGWRTVIVQDGDELRLCEGQLLIQGEAETVIPLEQLARVVLAKPSIMISSALLVALADRHISVMLCDKKYLPACQLVDMGQHVDAAGVLMDQAAWPQAVKDVIWARIIRLKLHTQAELLKRLGLKPVIPLRDYAEAVEPGDPTNREAMAARVYFNALFGVDFRRHTGGNINAALNYGYAILLSDMSRTLSMHGYHTALGLHHCSRENRFNLSCDLMEPFRPFVDAIVAANGDRELDWPYKKALIALPHTPCRYGSRRMDLETAVECFALDTMRAMRTEKDSMKVIDFAE